MKKNQAKPPSSSSKTPSSSSSARKSRWETAPDGGPSTSKEPAKPSSTPNKKEPDGNRDAPPPSSAAVPAAPPTHPFPAPTYGFQNLERRTIVLADGSVRSYFALPPDYPLDPYGQGGRPDPGFGRGFDRRFSPDRFREPPPRDYWLDGPPPAEAGPSAMKRKYPDDDHHDEFAWHRHHVSQYGRPIPPNLDRIQRYEDDLRMPKQMKLVGGGGRDELPAASVPAVLDVDPQALKRAFLKFAKTINVNAAQRKNLLEDGKNGRLFCDVCGRCEEGRQSGGLAVRRKEAQQSVVRRRDSPAVRREEARQSVVRRRGDLMVRREEASFEVGNLKILGTESE